MTAECKQGIFIISFTNGIFLAGASFYMSSLLLSHCKQHVGKALGRSAFRYLLVVSWIMLASGSGAFAQPFNHASNLSGFYQSGQVFLTWQEAADTTAFYKVYRSLSPISSGSQLANCEYLGMTDSHSSRDHDLSRHDGFDQFFVIETGKAPLSSNTGLFVATTLLQGAYYYAVTTVVGSIEDPTILPGANALQYPVEETVATPQPVLQQTRLVSSKPVEIYSIFISSKFAIDQPLMNSAGFIANDFAVYRNGATSGQHPLRIRFHGGGADFFNNIIVTQTDEINLNPENFLPNGDNSGWWGANENYNIYNTDSNEIPPATGINYNYYQQQITRMINWAITNLPVDSNRIYLEGSSLGSIGAYFYAITYPERIAAVRISGSIFDLSFQDDKYPGCTMNEGNINRTHGDTQFGTVESNLLSNSGLFFYDQMNGNWVTNTFKEKDYPFIYSMNGKNDTIVGWTEKTIYYQSLNTSHIGGYYFWDGRKHGGGSGLVWSDDNYSIFKYSKNLSFPAFANCSSNEDAGNGTAADGEAFGSVNGFLDWEENIEDTEAYWSVNIFLRDLKKTDGSLYGAPDYCAVDITPRRRQQFKPAAGDTLWWNVLLGNQVIQSGMQVYDGGLITISQIPVYKEGIQFKITTDAGSLSGNSQEDFLLSYPNPFTNMATFRWQVAESGPCSLKVYDVQGRLLRVLLDETLSEGIHQATWNGDNSLQQPLSPGVYLVRLDTPGKSATSKMVFAR